MIDGDPDTDSGSGFTIRLDKWLWQARFARSRGGAQRLIVDGAVRLNRKRVDRAQQPVRRGDVLSLILPHGTFLVEIVALGERRGPAEEARQLYRDISSPVPKATDQQ